MSSTPRPNPKHRNPRPTAQQRAAADDRRKELKYYGFAACMALWQARPDDIIRVYVTEATLKPFSPLLKWAAARRKAYHIVKDDDLERLTESIHHQGVCILAREPLPFSFTQLKAALEHKREPVLLAYLDGVENPHNLGAIVRTCANFGVEYLLGETDKLPKLSPAACRVAEGGAEFVRQVFLDDRDRALDSLQSMGFSIMASATRGKSVYIQQFPGRVVLVLGAEMSGVSKAILQAADATLMIPGTGKVESLNVSVAFALLAGEFARQRVVDTRGGERPRQRERKRKNP
jgi:TrmH RNA methyltransferase